jgi:hypothetical protein
VLHGEGDAEVGDERVRPVARLQEDVLGLHVAVDHAPRVGVGGVRGGEVREGENGESRGIRVRGGKRREGGRRRG